MSMIKVLVRSDKDEKRLVELLSSNDFSFILPESTKERINNTKVKNSINRKNALVVQEFLNTHDYESANNYLFENYTTTFLRYIRELNFTKEDIFNGLNEFFLQGNSAIMLITEICKDDYHALPKFLGPTRPFGNILQTLYIENKVINAIISDNYSIEVADTLQELKNEVSEYNFWKEHEDLIVGTLVYLFYSPTNKLSKRDIIKNLKIYIIRNKDSNTTFKDIHKYMPELGNKYIHHCYTKTAKTILKVKEIMSK